MILSRVVKRVAGRLERMAPEAPENTIDAVIMLAEAMRCYSQTLGTRDLFDFPKAILHALTDKDKKTIASECDERSDCVELKAGPKILKELYELKKLLRWTMLFSKKRFHAFLFAAGFDKDDVLFRQKTAGILKPAFSVIRDKESKCLFVFIRGTRCIKDILTDVIGAPVPFKLRRNMVSGYAHRGMLSAANWIEKDCTSILRKALRLYPDFKIKIVGHSLGGGTAALLTYKLREIKEFSSCTCVTFGPAACMTLELAEFGKHFITSIINGSDMVPTLSASSAHDFISKGRIKDKNILTAVGSSLSFAKAIAEHAVTRSTQVVMKHRQGTSTTSEKSCDSLLIEEQLIMEPMSDDDDDDEYNEGSDSDDSDDDEDELMNQVRKLKLEKQDNVPNIIHSKKKEAATSKNITDEESVCSVSTVNLERHAFYPPGKIMHIVHATCSENHNSNRMYPNEKRVYLYETPTQFYGKLRLTRGIILHHLTNKYRKKLQQLIYQLEKEQFQYGG